LDDKIDWHQQRPAAFAADAALAVLGRSDARNAKQAVRGVLLSGQGEKERTPRVVK